MDATDAQLRTIDLNALAENVRLLRSVVPKSAMLLAVVKADAYGHGAVQVARCALQNGATWLAVATAEEGAALRKAGIDAPILMLGAATRSAIETALPAGITLTVSSAASIHEVEAIAAAINLPAAVHLKLDTGMGRIGVREDAEIQAALEALSACRHTRLTGAFTHFAVADELTPAADAYTHAQLQRFQEMCALLPAGILRHCANSAAILRLMPEAAFDLVRMGICMYGYPPVPTDLPLKPLLCWTAEVTHVKRVPAGTCVSYGCIWTAQRESVIATIACGYGDGYHRAASGKAQVLLAGRRAPVVGRICMDQMMADVTDLPPIHPGDTAVLLGTDGAEAITAEDLAAWAGTISYEVLLAATSRVHRRWLPENDHVC